MVLDTTTFAAAIKQYYPEDVLKNMTYKNHAALALLPKKTDWVGSPFVVPITFGNPQGRSSTFARALANKGNSSLDRFLVTHVKDYSLASIDNLTIEMTGSNEGAFIDALKFEMDNAIAALGRSLSVGIWGTNGGAIGQISAGSDVGQTYITLANIADVVHFEVGQVIKSDTVNGGGTVNASSVTLTKVNRDTGVLTASAAWSTITGCAANDYLFTDGDYDARITGIPGWVPTSTPTTLFGVDRSVDPVRLGGVRVAASDVAGLPIEDKILHVAARIAREGGEPDTCFVSFETYRDLAISLHSKVMFVDVKNEDADVFFQGIRIIGAGTGPITVIPDRDVPANKAYVLELNSWKLVSTGAAPHILARDGQLSREASSDAYEVRIGFYGNVICNAPGHNGVVSLA